jgi:thiol-disulfide isomerase/thioredoxin
MTRSVLAAALSGCLLAAPGYAKVTVGSSAPAVEPVEWVNAKGAMSWKDLKGQVILLEKWATWCGPCVASIPHLNELTDKYGPQGLTIVGVSDEAVQKVKNFVTEKGMKYLIAIKGADEYQTDSIPHGWLISPRGEVVWEGHPADLKESAIEEQLKTALVAPKIALPKDLKSIERDIASAKYGEAMKALESQVKKPKTPEAGAAAQTALDQLKTYGTKRLEQAGTHAKAGDYGEAASVLKDLEKSYKGNEVGDKARDQLAEWKKDDKVKLELDGAAMLEKAETQIQAKQFKTAAGFLMQVTKGKKYEGTKARELAQKRLAYVERKI